MSSLLGVDSTDARVSAPSLAAFVRAVSTAALAGTASEALRALAEAAQTVTGADVALVRALDSEGERLEALAVAAPHALAAELEGTVLPVAELPEATLDELSQAPPAVRRIAERIGATQLLLVPARANGVAVSVELFRSGEPLRAGQRLAAELCAAQAALAGETTIRTDRSNPSLRHPLLDNHRPAHLGPESAVEESDQTLAGDPIWHWYRHLGH